MGRFDSLPGIDDENTTRRNVLVGGVYGLVGLSVIGGATGVGDDDDDQADTSSDDSADGESDSQTDTSGDDTTDDQQATDSDEEQQEEQLTDRELAEQSLRSGFNSADSDYRDGIREIDMLDGYNGRDGYLIELRYNLDLDGVTDLPGGAEFRAGKVAMSVLNAMSNTDADDVTAVGIYAYVPTSDGESAVSTKIVIDMADIDGLEVWQQLRDRADQYKFNSYLYN